MSRKAYSTIPSNKMGHFVPTYIKGVTNSLSHEKKPSTEQIDFDDETVRLDKHEGVEAQAVIAGISVGLYSPELAKASTIEVLSTLGLFQALDERRCCGRFCQRKGPVHDRD